MSESNFKMPRNLIGNLGEFIAYYLLSKEFEESTSGLGFLIPRGSDLINYGIPDYLSIPYQVYHTLNSLSLLVKKDKVEFPHIIKRSGRYFIIGEDGVEIPQEDNSYIENLLQNRPEGTNPDVSCDLLSFSCDPPESIQARLKSYSTNQRCDCNEVNCPIMLQKLQKVLLKKKKISKKKSSGIEDIESQWDEMEQLIEEYRPEPKYDGDLTTDEQEIINDYFRFLPPGSHSSHIGINGELLPLSEAIPYILSNNCDGQFNQAIIDYQLNCEYLKNIQLIEVKTVTNGTSISFTYAEIKTLQHISSMNFEVDCSYQVIVVNLANIIENKYPIYYLDNQKILAAAQNKTKLTKSYLKLLK